MKYLISLSAILFTSCLERNEIIFETKNISTHQKAVLALSPAQFTVGDIYYVFILGENDGVDGNDWGKVLIINDWDQVLPRDTSLIKIKWLHKDTLKVSYDSKLRIYNQVIKTRDNVIVYEALALSDTTTKSNN